MGKMRFNTSREFVKYKNSTSSLLDVTDYDRLEPYYDAVPLTNKSMLKLLILRISLNKLYIMNRIKDYAEER